MQAGTSALVEIVERLTKLAPAGLVVESAQTDNSAAILPEEEELIRDWMPQRRAQFALGRATARRALARLGVGATAIPFDQEGAPQWPLGTVGSISHKRNNCIVATASATSFVGIGIDLDFDRLETDEAAIVRRVCNSPRELAQAAAFAGTLASPGTLFLSAKEAFYKYQFPQTGQRLAWDEIEVVFEEHYFVARSLAPARAPVAGSLVVHGGWLATLVATEKSRLISNT